MTSLVINTESLNAGEALSAVAAVVPQIEFDPSWANGTGYFDRLAKTEIESESAIVAFKDNHERVGLVIRTAVGNIVLFHRFANGNNGVVVSNYPPRLNAIGRMMGLGSSVSKETLFNAVAWMGEVNGKWYVDQPDVVTAIYAILNGRADDDNE